MVEKPMWYENYEKLILPNAELVDKFGFYIPNHQDITTDDMDKMSEIINKNT